MSNDQVYMLLYMLPGIINSNFIWQSAGPASYSLILTPPPPQDICEVNTLSKENFC